MQRFRLTMFRAVIATGVFLALWLVLVFVLPRVQSRYFSSTEVLKIVNQLGWVMLYGLGFAWLIYFAERATHRIDTRRAMAKLSNAAKPSTLARTGQRVRNTKWNWNPFDQTAWYYVGTGVPLGAVMALIIAILLFVVVLLESGDGFRETFRSFLRRGHIEVLAAALIGGLLFIITFGRLRQSLAAMAVYTIVFLLVFFFMHWESFDKKAEAYEIPTGGGTDSIKASSMKVQQIIREKYVINPYSNIVFNAPPPIDQVELKLNAEATNQYKAGRGDGGLGEGEGEGGGFGSGENKGTYRYFRLRHSDKSWDKNFGIGGDQNFLRRFKAADPKLQTPGKVADNTESIDYSTLGGFTDKKFPPLIYIGGAQTFAPTAGEKKILKNYLIDQHGMILGDNLGGQGFHNNFIAVMNEVTGTTPVDIPRDDYIHQRPYEMPLLPIVVAHGGTTPKGWKIDGRWAVYYHPGALSDAWRDDRAGIKKEIADLCFQLGINIYYYAHREQYKWRKSQQP